MTNSSRGRDNLATARSRKAEQVAQIREQHPQLQRVEAELLRELAALTAVLARAGETGEAGAAADAIEKRIEQLRRERRQILATLNMEDDYAQTEAQCPICRDLLLVQDESGQWLPCSCQEERQLWQRRRSAGITSRMSEQTFANFSLDFYSTKKKDGSRESDYQYAETALKGCQRFVEEVCRGGAEFGLYIYGDPGIGKTHLVAAIANELTRRGIEVRYQVTAGLLASLRASYDEENRAQQSESSIIDDLSTTPVLILDDIGTERFTPWAVERFYQIINYRYLNKLPTVLTSNLPLDVMTNEMGEGGTALRIASRIAESCRVYLLVGLDIRFWKR